MILRLLQRHGHAPIVLVGGGTTKVGDPSGKDETRRLLDDATIDGNVAKIGAIFENFLVFGDGPSDARLVNNADWLDGLKYVEFLRDVGKHFSVNRMLSFESVKSRLGREQPLSFLEFNYMILQAYDAGPEEGDFNVPSTRECVAIICFKRNIHTSRTEREMIARPKMSRNEWKLTFERRVFDGFEKVTGFRIPGTTSSSCRGATARVCSWAGRTSGGTSWRGLS